MKRKLRLFMLTIMAIGLTGKAFSANIGIAIDATQLKKVSLPIEFSQRLMATPSLSFGMGARVRHDILANDSDTCQLLRFIKIGLNFKLTIAKQLQMVEKISPYFGLESGLILDVEWPDPKDEFRGEMMDVGLDTEVPCQLLFGVRYKISEWLRLYGEFRFETEVGRLLFENYGTLAAGYGFILFWPNDKKTKQCGI